MRRFGFQGADALASDRRLHDYVFMIVIVTVGFLLWAITSWRLVLSLDRELDILMVGLSIIMSIAAVIAATS